MSPLHSVGKEFGEDHFKSRSSLSLFPHSLVRHKFKFFKQSRSHHDIIKCLCPSGDLEGWIFFSKEISRQIHPKESHPAGLLAEPNPEGVEEIDPVTSYALGVLAAKTQPTELILGARRRIKLSYKKGYLPLNMSTRSLKQSKMMQKL